MDCSQVNIDTELTVASCTGFLAHHFVNGVHKINRATEVVPFGIRQLCFQECASHCIKRRSDRKPRVIVRLLRHNLASGGLVVMANVVVNQTPLLGPQS